MNTPEKFSQVSDEARADLIVAAHNNSPIERYSAVTGQWYLKRGDSFAHCVAYRVKP